MGEIAEQLADVVILTDDNPRMEDADAIVADILQGLSLPKAAVIERNRAKASRVRRDGVSAPSHINCGQGPRGLPNRRAQRHALQRP